MFAFSKAFQLALCAGAFVWSADASSSSASLEKTINTQEERDLSASCNREYNKNDSVDFEEYLLFEMATSGPVDSADLIAIQDAIFTELNDGVSCPRFKRAFFNIEGVTAIPGECTLLIISSCSEYLLFLVVGEEFSLREDLG